MVEQVGKRQNSTRATLYRFFKLTNPGSETTMIVQ